MFERPSRWLRVALHPAWAFRLYVMIHTSFSSLLDDRGQDLVEYAIVASLISLAAIVGMRSVATALATAYTNLGARLGTYIT